MEEDDSLMWGGRPQPHEDDHWWEMRSLAWGILGWYPRGERGNSGFCRYHKWSLNGMAKGRLAPI